MVMLCIVASYVFVGRNMDSDRPFGTDEENAIVPPWACTMSQMIFIPTPWEVVPPAS